MAHWYDQTGESRYQINKVGSKEKRDTTLADAKKFNWVPSVTTITGILSKPMVEAWKINILLEWLLTSEINFREKHDLELTKKQILSGVKGLWEKAANRGTEIHDKLETFFTTGKIDSVDEKILVPALNLLSHEFNGQKWIPEQGFAHKSGFGGKVDLHARGKTKHIILDFKTKAKDKLDKSCLYDDYCMQLAAYRQGLDMPDAECYNLFISTTKPGTLLLHKWDEESLKLGLKKFNLLLDYWKLQTKYDSSFEVL